MKKLFLAVAFLATVFFVTAEAAQIDSAKYLGEENLNYPIIIVGNSEVAGKINAAIRAEVQRFLAETDKQMAEGNFQSKTVATNFEIPCNYENGILSVIITEYVNFSGAAHPATFRRALNFNSDFGERIFAESLSEISPIENFYSAENLTRKLRNYAEKNNIQLFRDFQQLTSVPQDFYFDENLHVHFILQQYEVAPYAAGIIEFDATAQ